MLDNRAADRSLSPREREKEREREGLGVTVFRVWGGSFYKMQGSVFLAYPGLCKPAARGFGFQLDFQPEARVPKPLPELRAPQSKA